MHIEQKYVILITSLFRGGRKMDKHTSAKDLLCPKIDADKAWYLALLDQEAQFAYERDHLDAVLRMLKVFYILRYRRQIAQIGRAHV